MTLVAPQRNVLRVSKHTTNLGSMFVYSPKLFGSCTPDCICCQVPENTKGHIQHAHCQNICQVHIFRVKTFR